MFQFLIASPRPETTPRPGSCYPNPCGPYSICEVIGPRPVCHCKPGYFGKPPQCRPECTLSAECALNLACINEKCSDPCVGVCGTGALCHVNNHNPICSCPAGYRGSPFVRCEKIPGRASIFMIPAFSISSHISRHVSNTHFFGVLAIYVYDIANCARHMPFKYLGLAA